METVLITRHYSGFGNVEDTFSLGNSEHEGNASLSRYDLPAGYTVKSDRIFDTADIECAICAAGNKVMLVSRAGTCADIVLAECA